MQYTFRNEIFKEGNRYFIKVPFNVWEECGQKGLIPVEVSIGSTHFECRLVPKGNGIYYIPILKKLVSRIMDEAAEGTFQIIDGLTRINHDSPYSKQHPIRKIDNIQKLVYPKEGYCGQTCIAMLTGQSVEAIIDIMHAKAWQCSFIKLIETLDYFGIQHGDRVTYTHGKEFILPKCCIVNVRDERVSHYVLYYKGLYYDSKEFHFKDIINYLEIIVE